MRILRYFRLFLIILFLLLSLLALLEPPTNLLWKISIAVLEWGHYFAVISLVLLLLSRRNPVSVVMSGISLLLFLSPSIRGFAASVNVKNSLAREFGEHTQPGQRPLVLTDLFFGIAYDRAPFTTHVFNQEKDLSLDLYSPASQKTSPCVVVIHGGAWSAGDSRQLSDLNYYLADRGYTVAAVNYRLAPKFRYPDQISDIKDALAYLKSNSADLNIDRTSIVLLGRSAGGQLALQAAYTFRDPAIKGVISFYAPADMVWGYSVPSNPWIMDSRRILCDYIGAGCDVAPQKYAEASPVEHVSQASPPTLLLHGRPDVLVAFEHSRRMVKRLEEERVKHFLLELSWAAHGYDYNFSGPASQLSLYAINTFLHYTIPPGRNDILMSKRQMDQETEWYCQDNINY